MARTTTAKVRIVRLGWLLGTTAAVMFALGVAADAEEATNDTGDACTVVVEPSPGDDVGVSDGGGDVGDLGGGDGEVVAGEDGEPGVIEPDPSEPPDDGSVEEPPAPGEDPEPDPEPVPDDGVPPEPVPDGGDYGDDDRVVAESAASENTTTTSIAAATGTAAANQSGDTLPVTGASLALCTLGAGLFGGGLALRTLARRTP